VKSGILLDLANTSFVEF